MANSMYTPLSGLQRRTLIDAQQVFESYFAVQAQLAKDLKGSMHWKTVKGKEYLYHLRSRGRAASLGVRSPKTEAYIEKFQKAKAEFKSHSNELREQVDMQSRMLRAANLARVPETAARVIRALQKHDIPHVIIGTNALYAYEMLGGVLFTPDNLATQDMDVLFDARQGMRIAANLSGSSLLGLLQKTDKSFRRLSDKPFEFSATNKEDYRIDFLTQEQDRLSESEFRRVLAEDDLQPVEIASLRWLISSPRQSVMTFDQKGRAVTMNAIDPRAFVLHKHYVSQQPDRSAIKSYRDAAQARAVASMLSEFMPDLASANAIRKTFPDIVVQDAEDQLDDFSL